MAVHHQIGKLPFCPQRDLCFQVIVTQDPTITWINLLPGEGPVDTVDNISRLHDICCRNNATRAGKRKCDETMLSELDTLKPANKRERVDTHLAWCVKLVVQSTC